MNFTNILSLVVIIITKYLFPVLYLCITNHKEQQDETNNNQDRRGKV